MPLTDGLNSYDLDLANLAQINELIIRRMKTGVLVVDDVVVPDGELFSVLGFSLLYLVMLVGYVAYIVRAMRIGPERDYPDQADQSQPAPGLVAAGVSVPGLASREMS